MIEHSTEIKALIEALHQVQGHLTGVVKDSTNPHFKNRYASLENVIEAARGPLQAAGVTFTQAPGSILNNAVEITTMLMHKSGQWMRSTLHVPLAKVDPQGVGSAITYGCRYSLMAVLGLPPVDDDAEAAVGRPSVVRPMSAHAARKDGKYPALEEGVRACSSLDMLRQWYKDNQPTIETLPELWQDHLSEEYKKKNDELRAREPSASELRSAG